MYIFLVVVIALIGIIMSLVILLQAGKGGGLAGIASGGATTQILGARQAPDILEKGTWILATIFLILCVLTNFAINRGASQRSIIQQSQGAQQPPVQQETVPLPSGDVVPAPVEAAPGEATPVEDDQ